jgi:hypothetical protein
MIDFLIIGAQKSATTSIFKYLKEHPQIYLPDKKEIGFFAKDALFNQGLDWYKKELFESNSVNEHNKIVGEASHQYMFSIDAAARIYEKFPKIKIIVLLRNPIDRAFSAYKMLFNNKKINLDFDSEILRCIKENKSKKLFTDFQNVNILEAGKYSIILEEYFNLFPPENIFFEFSENINKNPKLVMKRLFNFLSVDSLFSSKIFEEKFHQGGKIKYNFLDKLINSISNNNSILITALKKTFPGTGYWLKQWNLTKNEDKVLSEKQKNILKDYYERDVIALEKILQLKVPWDEFNKKDIK